MWREESVPVDVLHHVSALGRALLDSRKRRAQRLDLLLAVERLQPRKGLALALTQSWLVRNRIEQDTPPRNLLNRVFDLNRKIVTAQIGWNLVAYRSY